MKRGTNGRHTDKNTFRIALGGIFLALTILCLYGASFVPGIELTLYACSSFFIAFMLLETGTVGAMLLFVATSLLGFFLLPNKLAMVPYIFLFGYYGILKYYLERLSGAAIQLILKAAFFALVVCAGILGFRQGLASSITLPDYPAALLIVGGVVLLLLYDYIYTFVISFYRRRIRHEGIDNMKLS